MRKADLMAAAALLATPLVPGIAAAQSSGMVYAAVWCERHGQQDYCTFQREFTYSSLAACKSGVDRLNHPAPVVVCNPTGSSNCTRYTAQDMVGKYVCVGRRVDLWTPQ
jgi:hypothetical protein